MDKKIKEHIRSLGCSDLKKIALAHQLYLELCEVRVMYDVDFVYNSDLDIIYLTARPSKTSNVHIYVPYSTAVPVSMKYMDELQRRLCNDSSNKCITLACVESDSTVVLYSFTSGLLPVDTPDCLVRQKTREERKDCLENEIKKNKYKILSKALENGITEVE